MVSARRIVSLLALLLSTAGLFGQEGGSPAPAARRLLLHVSQPPYAGLTDNLLFMVRRSVLLRLQEADQGIVVLESPETAVPGSDAHLGDLAKKVEADCWLWIEITEDNSGSHLRARSYDLLFQQPGFDTTLRREVKLSPLDLPFEKWDDLIAMVTDTFRAEDLAGPNAAGPGKATLTLRALPGTRITATRGLSATTNDDGMATLTVDSSAEYELRAVRAGFYPDTRRVFIMGNREITFDQAPASVWGLETSLLQLGYPGLGVMRFLAPNRLYVKLGFTTYALGLAFSDSEAFASDPLSNIVTQTGIYMGPEDALFRFYLDFGFFVRVIHESGGRPQIDPLSWGGFQFALGTEVAIAPRSKIFLEYVPMLYSVSVPGLFAASLGSEDKEPFGWSFSSKSAFNFLCFRVGYRWLQ